MKRIMMNHGTAVSRMKHWESFPTSSYKVTKAVSWRRCSWSSWCEICKVRATLKSTLDLQIQYFRCSPLKAVRVNKHVVHCSTVPPSTQYAIWTIRCIDGRKFVRTLKQSNSLTYNPSLSIYKVQSLLEFAKKIKKYFPPVDLFSLWISLLGPRTPTTLSWCSRSWSWWWIPHVQQIGLQTDICRERRVSKQKGCKKRQKIHPKNLTAQSHDTFWYLYQSVNNNHLRCSWLLALAFISVLAQFTVPTKRRRR